MASQNNPNYVVSSGDVLVHQYVGNHYIAQTITSAQGTTPQLIITGTPGYVITELGIQIDDNSTIGVAGMVSTKFTDSVYGDFFVLRWYMPASFSPKSGPSFNRQTNGPGFFWNNKTANSTVSVSLDTALTAGSVRFFARFAQTSMVGT